MDESKKEFHGKLVEFNGLLYGIGFAKASEGRIYLWDETVGKDGDWVEVVPLTSLTKKKDKEVI